jgi:hypothetical protein
MLTQPNRKEGGRVELGGYTRPSMKTATMAGHQVSVTTSRIHPLSEDRRRPYGSSGRTEDQKLAALKSYRRANGLCFKCGEKWNYNHHCSNSVPLHVVEEMWAVTDQGKEEGDTNPKDEHYETKNKEAVLAVSTVAVSGSENNRTIQLWASIHCQQVLVLVDSGSSASFMGTHLMEVVKGVQNLVRPVKVKVADGYYLWCEKWVPSYQWLCEGITFCTDFKLLPLDSYDLILGMDWLEDLSPMSIHWAAKWMEFVYKGKKVQLQGVTPKLKACTPMSSVQLKGLLRKEAVEQVIELRITMETETNTVPDQIVELVNKYQELFAAPKGLPPKRLFDHDIPLLPGVNPFRLRPYRYTPQQKNEIEKQITDRLEGGIIQQSSSPFAH